MKMTNGCGRKISPYDCCTIVTGDARELAPAIPDESVDLIFTDPVYDRIDDYRWLAETGARVLKVDTACFVYAGIGNLDGAITAMKGSLSYRWIMGGFYIGSPVPYRWFPCLWFEKGHSKAHMPVWDMEPVPIGHRLPDGDTAAHQWQKPVDWMARRLGAFTEVGAVVVDPFTGGGTVPAVCKMLGRHYLAFEIDPDVAERARERVRNTQPPLFVVQPEQTNMALFAAGNEVAL